MKAATALQLSMHR